jgi:acyl-CoA synthetase (AMP-forming)/AMP-acid ligase II
MYRPILETFERSAADWLFPVEKRSLTTAEILARASGVAALLHGHGIGRGSFVALSMENHSAFVAAALGAWRLGAALVPLRPIRAADFLEKIHAKSPLAALIHDGSCDAAAIHAFGGPRFEAATLADLAAADAPSVEVDPDAPALIQYSSGSTGAPKGVIVTHRMLVEQVDEIAGGFERGTGSPLRSLATWMPLYHDGGFFTGMMIPLLTGARNALATPRYYVANPARWFRLAAERNVDMVLATNAAMVLGLRQLVKHPGIDLRRCHLFLSAEKVSPQVLRRTIAWLESCLSNADHVHVPFGMAENTLSATGDYARAPKTGWFGIDERGVVTPGGRDVELVSCGPAYPGVSVAVCDEQDQALPELRLGEITIAGPCVMPGYIRDPEASAVALRGGRLHTNDLAFMHQGELWYVARKDDQIVVDGRNIVPDDVEHAVESLDFMRPGSTALVALERNESRELHLIVESAPDEEQRRQIREQILKTLDILVEHIHFCARGAVEKTSSGKKRRKIIRQRLAEGALEILGESASL